jgi:hypothetical protein
MLNSPPLRDRDATDDRALGAIVRAGPTGALTLAGIGRKSGVRRWFAFYLFVFLPRG